MRRNIPLPKVLLCMLLLIFLGSIPGTLNALHYQQNLSSIEFDRMSMADLFYKVQVDRKISVDLEDETIDQALKQISRETGLRLTYSGGIMEDKKITLKNESISVSDALADVLEGTGFEPRFSRNGYLLVVEAGEKLDDNALGNEIILQETIRGQVTDEHTGEALTGVNIIIEGTTIGTTSDVNGNFTLTVSSLDETLMFSYVGFLNQEIQIDDRLEINVELQPDVMGIDDLVVIGYGTQRRKDLTGSLSSVTAEDFADLAVSSVDEVLAGHIPGLDVVASGHLPGQDSQILLRGRRSFTASNDPLIIMDDMPFHGSLNDINPYDILSVDVLKDASSTAIYGSRGANGVIIITTKRGDVGPAKFMVGSSAASDVAYGRLPYMNAEQYAERGREAFRMAGNYPDSDINTALDETYFDPTEYRNMQAGNSVDYPELLLQNGFQQKHQLSVMGGSEAVKYNIAGNMLTEEGMYPGRIFDRYSVRTNLDFNLSSRVSVGTSVLLSHHITEAKADDGILGVAIQRSPLGTAYEEDGTPRYMPTGDGFQPHPLADYEFDSFRWDNKTWAAYITTFAEVEIFPELTYRLNLGTDLNLHNLKTSEGQYSHNRRGGPPIAGVSNSVGNQNLIENIITYDKNFSENHQLTLTGIHGLQTSKTETSNTNVSELPYEPSRYHNIGSAETISSVSSNLMEWNLLSYAARAFYGYKSKYLITLSIRADGASQFSPNHKWGYFPSASVAWNISDEKFLDNIDMLSNLRLRASYGVSGNQGISPYQTQGNLSRTTYAWDESPAYGYRSSTLSNQNLKWESTETYNLGLDLGFFKGRVNGNMELYNTNTYDLIMQRLLPITTGYNAVLENIGSTNNKGFELGLNTVNIDNSNFNWDSGLSFYLNREQIVELYDGEEDDIGNQWFIGQPINVYYDYNKLGIWQLDEEDEAAGYNRRPGQIKVEDIAGNGQVTDSDRTIVGTREPSFVANISNRFAYKDWDLSFTTYARWGNTIYVNAFNPHSGKRYNGLALDYWTPNNPTNSFARPDDNVQGSLQGSSQAYRDGSFVRLRQLSLGYTIPQSLLNTTQISSARIYLSGENLWYWTKSEMREFNMEPEWSGDAGLLPAVRSFIAGINVTF